MNHAVINGFIVSSEDEIKVTPPTAKGGKKLKVTDLNKTIDKHGLDIASDYFTQAITNIQQAQKIIDKLADHIDRDLKAVI